MSQPAANQIEEEGSTYVTQIEQPCAAGADGRDSVKDNNMDTGINPKKRKEKGGAEKLAKRYGNVYSLFIGPRPVVVINGLQALKEALINKADDFSGRPQDQMVNHAVVVKANAPGVVLADYNPAWKQQRRFGLMTLRNLGLGKHSMEQRILGEIHRMTKILEQSVGMSQEPRVLSSSPHIWAGLLISSSEACDCKYGCAILEELDYLCNLIGLQEGHRSVGAQHPSGSYAGQRRTQTGMQAVEAPWRRIQSPEHCRPAVEGNLRCRQSVVSGPDPDEEEPPLLGGHQLGGPDCYQQTRPRSGWRDSGEARL
uniref:cytochrome P450 1A1-like n=1 Tax=Epinephelus lanceolatus TaxID=310571 RepID=UPI001444A5F0|nr:cytochrome P450 1A1-like [Epinephelus lanceolatus]